MSDDKIETNGEVYVRAGSFEKPSGDYVVVRTYSAGVHAGYLKSRKGKEVVLENCRRLYYWEGAATLSQVAGKGISRPEKCKFPSPIAEITLTESIEIIPCTDIAKSIIEGVEEWVA